MIDDKQTIADLNQLISDMRADRAAMFNEEQAKQKTLRDALSDCLEIVEAELADDPEPEDLPSWHRAIAKANAALGRGEVIPLAAITVNSDEVIPKFEPDKDCDENGQTNMVRADRAASAVATYAREGGYGQPDDPCVIQDLICDLGHLTQRREENIHEIIDSGLSCWMQER